ncbi:MAG: glycosyltransferase [Candidatus Krumholzibacteriota bacterium]|nr:glycosyltransferase [Candidatus Krumholzibacteriota bacterium]
MVIKKILSIGFFPPRRSGAAITNHEICNKLSLSNKVIALSPLLEVHAKMPVDKYFKTKKYSLVKLKNKLPPASKRVYQNTITEIGKRFSPEILNYINSFQPDIVFIMHESILWYLEGYLLKMNVPFYCLCHGSPITQLSDYGSIERDYFLNTLSQMKKVFVISKYLSDLLKSFHIRSSLPFGDGLNTNLFNSYKRKQVSSQKKIQIMHVSNFKEGKQINEFYRLASIMKDRKNLKFLAIGNPHLNEAVIDIENNVVNIAWLPYEQTLDFMNKADILVVTSQREGLSRIIRESQLLGKVPIAPDLEVFRESIENEATGFLYDVDDERSLSITLQRIIAKFEMVKYLICAKRKYFFQQYGIPKLINEDIW